MAESSEREEPDEDSQPSRYVELARRALRWLRDLHRGYASTGHLPYRKD
jgi:hypothetical protein